MSIANDLRANLPPACSELGATHQTCDAPLGTPVAARCIPMTALSPELRQISGGAEINAAIVLPIVKILGKGALEKLPNLLPPHMKLTSTWL